MATFRVEKIASYAFKSRSWYFFVRELFKSVYEPPVPFIWDSPRTRMVFARISLRACKITSPSLTRIRWWTLNGIWSFLRPCLQANRFNLKWVKDSPPLPAKCFRQGYPAATWEWTLAGQFQQRSTKAGNIFPGTFMVRACFPLYHTWKIVSSVSFCFQDANYAYDTRKSEHVSSCKRIASSSKRTLI